MRSVSRSVLLALALLTLSSSLHAQKPQTRQGFWFNIGVGYGSLGCDICDGREGGLSGGLSLGGTLSQKVLLGVGTAGWAKDYFGETLTVGTLDARIRFYPSATGGFFLTGGLGIGTISYSGTTETGLGLLLGLGFDIRVGSNVSLTPFWNGFAVRTSTDDGNVGQIGVGVTIH
jgi:outer membrane protein with beta-barrel domain